MPDHIPSLTEVLEARRRAGEAIKKSDPEAALADLTRLDRELPWPARAEVWEALVRLGSQEAALRLLAIAETLTEKPQQKRMRRVIHQLRSRGVPVQEPPSGKEPPSGQDPSSGPGRDPAGKPRRASTRTAGFREQDEDLPPLRAWASCADGEGAYQLLAHLHGPTSSLAGLACFAVTRGARDFMVFPVDHPRQVDELLDRMDEEAASGMPPLHPIDPETWLALARQALRDHEDGGFPDPDDLPMWKVLLDGVGQAIEPREPQPDPRYTPPEDPVRAASDLLDHPGYQAWFFDAKDLPGPLVKRTADLVGQPSTASHQGALDELARDMLQAVDAAHLKNLWQHMLRYNARVHLALGESAAGDALWFAGLFDTVPFTDHPLAREVARRTPWRLYRDPDEDESGMSLNDLWEVEGWSALERFDGPERLSAAEQLVDFWVGDSENAARGRETALKRQWGREPERYLKESKLTLGVLIPASAHFHQWDFRHTHRSKTVAEKLQGRFDEVPEEARPFLRGFVNAVTSIYQVLDLNGDGTVVVEDYLSDGRLVVRTRGEFRGEARKRYPILIGKVFPVGGQTWLAMACPPLPARIKPRLVAHLEESFGAYSGLRVSVDQLRRKPQAIWRALRAADEDLTGQNEALRRSLDRLPRNMGGGEGLDFEDLDDEAKASVRGHLTDYLTKHYMNWLDQRIPALGYQTPRESVREQHGRRQVADMLREIEAMFADHPQGVDLSDLLARMRRELRLDG